MNFNSLPCSSKTFAFLLSVSLQIARPPSRTSGPLVSKQFGDVVTTSDFCEVVHSQKEFFGRGMRNSSA